MSHRHMLRLARGAGAIVLGLFIIFVQTGCETSYATPGRAADFKAIGLTRDQLTDVSIAQALAKVPLAQFPCGVAAVRIQAPDYRAEGVETWGRGKYCVVTTRDLEGDELQKLSKLPSVDGIVSLNRLVLPRELNSDLELREAAANLHADMLFGKLEKSMEDSWKRIVKKYDANETTRSS